MAIRKKFKLLQLKKDPAKENKLFLTEVYSFTFQVYDKDASVPFDYADPCYNR